VRNEENSETVRQVIEEHPNTSIRHLKQVNLSYRLYHLLACSESRSSFTSLLSTTIT
jgi:hypothetical protein